MVWLKEYLYWGLLNTKGQQGYTVLHRFIILRRIRHEPEATRSCPPVTWPSYNAIWGWPPFWVIYNVNSGAEETGLGNASFAAPGDLGGLFKVATPPGGERRPPILGDARFRYSRVHPLLLGKGQAPSPDRLTGWQIKLGLCGHIHKSCVSLNGWRICTLSKVRCGTLFIFRSRASLPKIQEEALRLSMLQVHFELLWNFETRTLNFTLFYKWGCLIPRLN